ncbi:hypothetical protein [Nocardia caishijiensis]|uniref:Uncharacterized protein n=1 Tax=Nocardia caishijiensis TaxID=184756 RepID=A0ABQ6YHL6_9NOCA|nr:hypothetical protein [Nocardia caishijiensis]KAF0845287.1 hypothetical protein FNL39_10895 [Nocardia caishijiensis]
MQIFLIVATVFGLSVVGGFAIGFGTGLVVILIGAVAIVILGVVLSFIAKRQVDYIVPVPRGDVAQLIVGEFRKLGWKAVDGRGEFNFRSWGFGLGVAGFGDFQALGHPVMSIDLEDHPGGGTEVSIWMSEGKSRWGQVGGVDRFLSKRWTLSRRLAALAATSDNPAEL